MKEKIRKLFSNVWTIPNVLTIIRMLLIPVFVVLFFHEEEIKVAHCPGTLGLAQTGSEDFVEMCMWYDLVPGLMYSVTAQGMDLDGFDIQAIAEQLYIPTQGDVG